VCVQNQHTWKLFYFVIWTTFQTLVPKTSVYHHSKAPIVRTLWISLHLDLNLSPRSMPLEVDSLFGSCLHLLALRFHSEMLLFLRMQLASVAFDTLVHTWWLTAPVNSSPFKSSCLL
jgi:hypothetical protein